jgi:hypothetical protein
MWLPCIFNVVIQTTCLAMTDRGKAPFPGPPGRLALLQLDRQGWIVRSRPKQARGVRHCGTKGAVTVTVVCSPQRDERNSVMA